MPDSFATSYPYANPPIEISDPTLVELPVEIANEYPVLVIEIGTPTVGPKGDPGAPGLRGTRWYVGAGPPDVIPPATWAPSGVSLPPLPGDLYLNSVDGTYYELE